MALARSMFLRKLATIWGRSAAVLGRSGSAAGFDGEVHVARPGADLGPVLGVLRGGVEGVLQEDGVELLFGAIVEEAAVVPSLEAEAVGVDAEGPGLGGRGGEGGGGEGESGAEEVAAGRDMRVSRGQAATGRRGLMAQLCTRRQECVIGFRPCDFWVSYFSLP